MIRAAAIRNLEPSVADRIVWSRNQIPTISNIEILRASSLFRGPRGDMLLQHLAERTVFEQPGASWSSALDYIDRFPLLAPDVSLLPAMASAFNRHILPMATEPGTRDGHWDNWRSVLTWAVAYGAVELLLPMSLDTLKALSWQLVTLRCSPALMQNIWGTIAQRHHAFDLVPPLSRPGEYGRWLHAVSVSPGRPRLLKFPIQREHIVRLLSLPGLRDLPFVQQRNILATIVSTICCTRVSEVAALQACDLLYDLDCLRGERQYEGTLAVRINKRKNDSIRKGLFPRLGRPRHSDPAFDVVDWLKEYQLRFGLGKHQGCIRPFRDRQRCPVCPPVFSMAARHGGTTIVTKEPCSRQLMSSAIERALTYIGVDPSLFSGISARKGGISTAIEAGVPEWVLFFQSGHGQSKAARAYMALDSPTFLFATWDAFRL